MFIEFTEIDPQSIVSSIITDSGISDVSETPQAIFDRPSATIPVNSNHQNLSAQQQQQQQQQHAQNVNEMGHSRNSSNTSQVRRRNLMKWRDLSCINFQMSKGSGYSSSVSERQHSRQSSDGDSGHTR